MSLFSSHRCAQVSPALLLCWTVCLWVPVILLLSRHQTHKSAECRLCRGNCSSELRTLCSSTAQKQAFLCVCRSKVAVLLKWSRSSTQVAPLGVVSRRHGAARTAGLELLVQTSNVHMMHQRASVSADGVSSAVRRTAGFKYSFCSGELPRVFLFLW